MSAAHNFAPGSEVEWDRMPPVQGVQRGMVVRMSDGMVKVAYLRRNRSGCIVIAMTWFEPHEVGQLRIAAGGAR